MALMVYISKCCMMNLVLKQSALQIQMSGNPYCNKSGEMYIFIVQSIIISPLCSTLYLLSVPLIISFNDLVRPVLVGISIVTKMERKRERLPKMRQKQEEENAIKGQTQRGRRIGEIHRKA